MGGNSKSDPTTGSNTHAWPASPIFLRTTTQPVNMPPKGKKAQDRGKSGEEERDEPLQAVVRPAMHPLPPPQCS